ncbi:MULTISPECIES: NUDIX domain-containing protein [unclassified Devosia]|uniref:NUDIX domain-containing protein n=1 Tax=unclassified Devosia TaxID=196773 RepID=UPI00086C1546|nr:MULTISPECIES: NUDIX domain-containing protein [unclassified Devosia]MBN9361961.1 NUDIX domain-containing protein [Devosia sp.]ODS80907.1 MAG: GDP-mannose pyrophosphatase [Devosia sp. SCN 66-27]OJX20654.1 MAG: GDP-mannose pyrophosphatase [Devosia sp. 66-14]
MNEKVRVLGEQVLSDNWGLVKKTTIELKRRNGEWQRQVRETYDRGDGAGVLLYNRAQRTVILTRQFRFPVFAHGEAGYLIEVVAGKLDGDHPVTTARKEAEEESGYRVHDVELVMSAYMSPGSVTEKLSLFLAEYDAGSKVSSGGGLEDEGEDIEVLELGIDQALRMIETGEIADAKTIMLLQHVRLKGIL